jgi:hypothetical protein
LSLAIGSARAVRASVLTIVNAKQNFAHDFIGRKIVQEQKKEESFAAVRRRSRSRSRETMVGYHCPSVDSIELAF